MLANKLFGSELGDLGPNGVAPTFGIMPNNGYVFAYTDLTTAGNGTWSGSYGVAGTSGNFNVYAGFRLKNVLVRGVSPGSVFTATPGWLPNGIAGGTVGSAGTHGTLAPTPLYFNTAMGVTQSGVTVWRGDSGAHTHTINVKWSDTDSTIPASGRFPANQVKGLGVFRKPGANILPQGTVVLGISTPNSFSAYTGHDGYFANYVSGSSLLNIVLTPSGGTVSTTLSTTSSSGGHSHFGGPTQTYSTSIGSPIVAVSGIYNGHGATGGAHTHTVSATGAFTFAVNNWMTVKAFVAPVGGARITSGTIILWGDRSTELPAGWYFCNGQTVNGVTTPNLNAGYIIKFDSAQATGTVVNNGTNTVSLSAAGLAAPVSPTNPAPYSHAHYPSALGTYNTTSGRTIQEHHETYNWPHTHTGTTGPFSDNCEPCTCGFSFIIYLP
jgi:hypothetical protein